MSILVGQSRDLRHAHMPTGQRVRPQRSQCSPELAALPLCDQLLTPLPRPVSSTSVLFASQRLAPPGRML
jgi:hypothetical protein